MNMDVSIIIVNYNTLKMTQECIDSVFENTTGLDFEVILVDNGSCDGSKEHFENEKRVTYIYSNENLGFGRANNLGYKYAKGEFLFFLNSDTIIENDAIRSFLEYENENGGDKLLGCYLVDNKREYSPSYGKFPTVQSELKIALNVYLSRLPFFCRHNYYKLEQVESTQLNVDYIIGADMFVPRIIIDSCGLFDERFFMYYEETDFQRRVANAGYERIIIPGPQITHLCQGSQKKENKPLMKNLRKSTMTDTSKLIYLKKYNRLLCFYFFKCAFFSLRFFPVLLMKAPIKAKLTYYSLFFKKTI